MRGYHGVTAALATQHGKERAIAPVLAERTGLSVRVPAGIDTDSLGTFTGEIARAGSMREAALMKARLGMAASGLAIGIASEGSFGPHPFMPFLARGREVIAFIDAALGIEVVEEATSEQTNFAALEIERGADVEGFLRRIGFPSHAVVLRCGEQISKGISSHDALNALLRRCAGPARLETDMRAHLNPTRMAEIARLAGKLAHRLATPCPACAAPGFGTLRREAGLPCEECGTPTLVTRALVSGCVLCPHEERIIDERRAAAPADCPMCNP